MLEETTQQPVTSSNLIFIHYTTEPSPFLSSGPQILVVAPFTSQAPICRGMAISLPLHEIASADFISLATTEGGLSMQK